MEPSQTFLMVLFVIVSVFCYEAVEKFERDMLIYYLFLL